jgi:hypothetical protein
MRQVTRFLASCLCLALACSPLHARESSQDSKHDSGDEPDLPRFLKDESQTTAGSITVKGAKLIYQAEAGVQVVYLKDPKDDDAPPKSD